MIRSAHLHESTEFNLVLLHGWGMNSGIYDDFCEQLQGIIAEDNFLQLNVRSIDLPGYGDKVDDDVTGDSLAQLAHRIEQQLPFNSVVFAWSLGGLIAQELAIQGSKKLAALICMCSSPKFVSDLNWPGIQEDVLQTFQAQLSSDNMKTLKRFLAIQNMGQVSAKSNIAKMVQAISVKPIAKTGTLNHGLEILQNSDIRERLHLIKVPTLRLYGKLDALVPHGAVDMIHRFHPQSEQRVYPKASHAPFLSHGEELIKDTLTFLKVCKKD